jgi:hypothetical protein
MAYKYHTAQEYHQLILETEAQIDEQHQLDQLHRWAADPANAAQLAHIRSELDRVAPQRQPQRQAPAPAPQPVHRVPSSKKSARGSRLGNPNWKV